MTPDTDTLADAVGRLDHAAAELFSVQYGTIAGTARTAPSIWQQLNTERFEKPSGNGARNSTHSIPTARLDLLALCDEITASLGDNPAQEIDQWCTVTAWRPQDTARIYALAAQVQAWHTRAEELLRGGSRLEVRAPCPQCGRRYEYEDDGIGGQKRRPCLTVTTVKAECRICHATWKPEQYGLLIRILESEEP